MRKSQAVTEALIYVGMIAIGVLMFVQIPKMVDDIKAVTSSESVVEQSKAIANLLSLVYAAPNDIKIPYDFPAGVSYSISVRNGYVNVSTSNEWAVAKTLSSIEFPKANMQHLTITKERIE